MYEWNVSDGKPFNYLQNYLTDDYAESHRLVPIVLDMAEVSNADFLEIADIPDSKRKFVERWCKHKINANEQGGYNYIKVRCPNPAHDEQFYFIESGTDPYEKPIKCRLCIQEKMKEIDNKRFLRCEEIAKQKKAEKEAEKKYRGYK